MRIAAGRHRGRRIGAGAGRAVRPTPARVREALFDILRHRFGADAGGALADARVLDAFCGTGALGLEALSQGAGGAAFMDADPAALRACRRNVAALGETGRAEIMRCDCLRPPPARAPCGILLADPPYRRGLAAPALAALDAAGWLAPGALCFVETAAGEALEAPPGFEALDERIYGATALRILRRRDPDGGRAGGR